MVSRRTGRKIDTVLEAALGRRGLALAPAWQVAPLVATGRLRIVLDSFTTPPVPVQALHAAARLRSAKVRRFLAFATGLRAPDLAAGAARVRVAAI